MLLIGLLAVGVAVGTVCCLVCLAGFVVGAVCCVAHWFVGGWCCRWPGLLFGFLGWFCRWHGLLLVGSLVVGLAEGLLCC